MFALDVWGNEQEGFVINDWQKAGRIHVRTFEYLYDVIQFRDKEKVGSPGNPYRSDFPTRTPYVLWFEGSYLPGEEKAYAAQDAAKKKALYGALVRANMVMPNALSNIRIEDIGDVLEVQRKRNGMPLLHLHFKGFGLKRVRS